MAEHNDTTILDLTGRIEERGANRKRIIITSIVAVMVLIGAGTVAYFSPLLAVERVNVEGTQLTDPTQVHDFVAERTLGTPLPQVPLSRIADEAAAEFPKAAEVSLSWSGPRQLTVSVTDRKPVLAVKRGGQWLRFDETGAEIDTVSDPGDLIRLASANTDKDAVLAALELLAAFSPEEQQSFTAVYANSSTDLRADYLTGEDSTVQIRFGDAHDAALKLSRAKTLSERAKEYVDVSMPDHPVTK